MSSAIECVFREFKDECRIENALVNKFVEPKELKISVQCIEQKMDLYHERRRLFELCKKHGIHYISCPWNINFDIFEIISIKSLCHSTLLFIFSKKKILHFLVNKL